MLLESQEIADSKFFGLKWNFSHFGDSLGTDTTGNHLKVHKFTLNFKKAN